jgi:hypothetical protein
MDTGSASQKCVRLSKSLHRRVALFVFTFALFATESQLANAQVTLCDPDSLLSAGSQDCSQGIASVSALPNTPSQVINPQPINRQSPYLESPVPGVRDLAIDSYKKPKTIDRQFLIFNALMIAATVADAETTLNCVSSPNCEEVNPLLGSHPTRGRVYAVGVPLTAFAIYLSYHYKRVSPTRNWWKAYPLVLTVVHTFGAVNNLSASHGQ